MTMSVSCCAIALAVTLALTSPADAAASDDNFLGDFNPEDSCDGPVSSPVCAYKTWFYCRMADEDDMCHLVLGNGPEKKWAQEPWRLGLSDLMQGPLSVYGFGFAGAYKVTAERFGPGQDRIKRRLLGAYEVRDTYADPNDHHVAYIGSEFYAETKPGRWTLVGWTLDVEGGKGDVGCDDASGKNSDEICKLRIDGLKSWANLLRERKGGTK